MCMFACRGEMQPVVGVEVGLPTQGDAWPTPGVEKGLQTWDLPKVMHSPLWVWRGAFQPNLKLTNVDGDVTVDVSTCICNQFWVWTRN